MQYIVFAVNSPRLWDTQERVAGFGQAMREANARPVVRVVGMTVQEAQISLANLFRESDRPTGLFTNNNFVTLGAVQAQLECDLRVPNEMSLLAFDDFEWLKLLRPAVSAIQQPVDQIPSRFGV